MKKRSYRYKIKKVIPELHLPGGYVLPETYSEVDLNHPPIFLINPEIKPIGVLWLEIWDNQTGKLIYKWPKEGQ